MIQACLQIAPETAQQTETNPVLSSFSDGLCGRCLKSRRSELRVAFLVAAYRDRRRAGDFVEGDIDTVLSSINTPR